MKKGLAVGLLGLMILSTSWVKVHAESMTLRYDGKVHEYQFSPISLYINDEKIETTVMPPIQLEGRVLVPAREVFEPMGAEVEWKPYEKKVYINYKEMLMILEPDKKEVWLNGETLYLDVPAKVINEKIMLPVRFISEAIGFDVKWDGTQKSVRIVDLNTTEKPVEPDTPIEPEKPVEPDTPIEPEKPDKEDTSDLQGVTKVYTGNDTTHDMYITQQDFPKTTIQKIAINQGFTGTTCEITAQSELSGAEISIKEGKIIIDIPNSTNKLSTSIVPTYNSFVEKIRTSQFTETVSRIVLDLKSGVKVSASLSEDRKQLLLALTEQELEMLAVGGDALGDYVILKNLAPAQLNVKNDSLNKTLTLTIPNTFIPDKIKWDNLGGTYIESLDAENTLSGLIINIPLDTQESYIHNIESVNGETIIRLMKPTFKNINYGLNDKGVIEIKKTSGLNANTISVQDYYRERKIVVDLKGDYESHLGYGTLIAGDEKVKNIEIVTQGTTKLIINEQAVQAFNIREDEKSIYIELVKPKEKYEKILFLDAGHGGSDNGASANGLKEKDINLKQALAVKQLIEQNTDIKVYMNREDDSTMVLDRRTDLTNDIEADIFISMHNNSAGPNVSGTEVFYYASSATSKRMAEIVQRNILQACQTKDRKIKADTGLFVLRTSKMPAILIETGFVTNAMEAANLNSETFNTTLANAVCDAIIEMFDTLSFR